MLELVVDEELRELIPPLDAEERRLLEESILRDGCRHPLIVWEKDGQRILIDGHNRYDICRTHSADFDIEIEPFEDRTQVILWMIENQMGRRNLADIDRINLARRKEDIVRLKAKANQATSTGGSSPQLSANLPKAESKVDTRKEVAKAAGVGERTYDAGKAILEAVESGELDASVLDDIRHKDKSINGTFTELKKKRKANEEPAVKPRKEFNEDKERDYLFDKMRSTIEKTTSSILVRWPDEKQDEAEQWIKQALKEFI